MIKCWLPQYSKARSIVCHTKKEDNVQYIIMATNQDLYRGIRL